MAHELITTWRTSTFDDPPFFLNDDLITFCDEEITTDADSYKKYIENKKFVIGSKKIRARYKSMLHLNLIPVPFQGDLATAKIFICLINPGLSPLDYIVEKDAGYRDVLLKNLKQEFGRNEYRFFSLDPKWAWTGGGAWWASLVRSIVQELIEKGHHKDYSEASKRIAESVAVLELVPYHSINANQVPKLARRLASARLIKDFVKTEVLKKVRKNEALLVIAGGARMWEIKSKHRNVIYPAKNGPPKAHLAMEKGGAGRRIYKWLTT